MVQKTVIAACSLMIGLAACQQDTQKEHEKISKEAIEVHDEIMPQIRHFDRSSVKIDSILSNLEGIKLEHTELDTTNTRVELKELQAKIESANGFMMEWMRDYQPDSTDVAYQKQELENVKLMKNQFENVQQEIDERLQPFNR